MFDAFCDTLLFTFIHIYFTFDSDLSRGLWEILHPKDPGVS